MPPSLLAILRNISTDSNRRGICFQFWHLSENADFKANVMMASAGAAAGFEKSLSPLQVSSLKLMEGGGRREKDGVGQRSGCSHGDG